MASSLLPKTTSKQPPGLSWCRVCGAQVRKAGSRWRHMRPQPSGQQHDHSAVPGAAKPSEREG